MTKNTKIEISGLQKQYVVGRKITLSESLANTHAQTGNGQVPNKFKSPSTLQYTSKNNENKKKGGGAENNNDRCHVLRDYYKASGQGGSQCGQEQRNPAGQGGTGGRGTASYHHHHSHSIPLVLFPLSLSLSLSLYPFSQETKLFCQRILKSTWSSPHKMMSPLGLRQLVGTNSWVCTVNYLTF